MGGFASGRVIGYMNGAMNDDPQLLRRYVQERSEQAFRELVERHIPLVNATARRLIGSNVHLADDVTQTVFTDLARKAATLPKGMPLGGWLHRHTCFTATKAIRGENRRRARERTAMETNLLNEESARDEQWAKLAPVLDDALNQLGEIDREAIVLRYLQQRDLRSVGLALGATESAVQKRLVRALEKLREVLTRRGITVSAALLATAMDAGAGTAPISSGLAATVSITALNHAASAATASFTSILFNAMTSKYSLGLTAIIVAIATLHVISQSGCQSGTTASSAQPVAQPVIAAVGPTKTIAPITIAAAPAGSTATTTASATVSDPGLLDLLTPKPGQPGPTYNISPLSFSGRQVALTLRNGIVAFGTLNFPQQEMRNHPMDEIIKTSNFVRQTLVSSVTNADGTVTDTYSAPDGATIRVVKSADGKSAATQVRLNGFSRAQ